MKIPTVQEAESLLKEAEKLNPGQWVEHSIYAARAAEAIAQNHPQLDPGIGYVMGLLHDIGRREGRRQMRHIIDGYNYMKTAGFDDMARICLTHSFPLKDITAAIAEWDCPDTDREFVGSYIADVKYNDYDRLIQLCDYLALPTGFSLIEKRMIDVALRYGTNEYSVPKWKAIMDIKQDFEKIIGCSIYSLLPGVVENTFETGLI